MRIIVGVCVLLVTAGTARADAPCHVAIEMRGAIVDGTTTLRLEPTDETTSHDFELPDGGHLVEVALRGGSSGTSLLVSTAFSSQLVTDTSAVGADPAIAMQLADHEVRVVLQPITGTPTLVLHWTALADIADGEVRVRIPRYADGDCAGTFHAVSGPGATVARVRVDADAARGASTSFVTSAYAVDLAAELAFTRPEPIAWVQEEPLGDGTTARAVTVVAPPSHVLARTKRVLFVVDNSRSMNLVGRAHVAELIEHVGAALAPDASVEAIAFDRAPARVLGAWTRADPVTFTAITAAIQKREPANGSDLGAAFAMAHSLLAEGTHDPAIVVVLTDGVLGDVDAAALAAKLGDARDVDLHAIVLDPTPHMQSPSRAALEGASARLGGSYSELEAGDVTTSPHLASWLEPAWQVGDGQLRAGEGKVSFELVKAGRPAAFAAHDETAKLSVTPRPAPATPLVGQLALASLAAADMRVLARHPFADVNHDLAIIGTTGRVAANRRAMVAGGGPYTRMIAVEDPSSAFEPISVLTQPAPRATVIDHEILQRVFELQLQPVAYHCFQRALGRAPELAGTVQFGIELGRGEVTHVTLAGTGDAAFDGCLVDAAYSLQVPLVDPKLDPDDRTIANYPLTFSVRAEKPVVVAGDADSSSPIDIDAIKGGVPALRRRGPVHVQDTTTPLGPLRPGK